jgi:hypothetical protein
MMLGATAPLDANTPEKIIAVIGPGLWSRCGRLTRGGVVKVTAVTELVGYVLENGML